MKCKYPIIMSGRAFGCGQCICCRTNRRRVWTHRMMLEASQYEENAFVTLTYREDEIPPNGSLEPSHLRNYLKRLRKRLAPQHVRYVGVGEYGDNSQRPHYHLALFGVRTCERGISQYHRRDLYCCEVCDLHSKTWGHGNVYLGQLSDQSAAYICGYVVKKLTRKGDEKLSGRYPEFARMSNRPGIGAGFMDEVASTLMEHRLDETMEDVPAALRHGKTIMPLGRYLRRRLRERIGRDRNAPQSTLDKMEAELLPLREATKDAPRGFKMLALRQAIIDKNYGRALQIEGKIARQRNKGSL